MITLLIPTINRFYFIKKYFIYLNASGFNGQVLIGDSSDESNFDATKNYIESNIFTFEVTQYSFPDMYPHQCIKKMLKDIKFSYCMFICDDDILVLNTLKKCIKFLDHNQSYSGVGGVSVRLELDPDNYNNIVSSSVYPVREIECQTASERVIDLFSNYSVIAYSLARTEEFICRWPDDVNGENYDKAIGSEILPCAILAAQGKVKMIDELFVVRQLHEDRIILPTFIDSFLHPQWVTTLHFAVDKLSDIVSSIDEISYNKAYITVNNAWKEHLVNSLRNSYCSRNLSVYQQILIKVKILFGNKIFSKFLKIYQLITLLTNKKSVRLPALLKSSSPYYADFKEIYDVIEGHGR